MAYDLGAVTMEDKTEIARFSADLRLAFPQPEERNDFERRVVAILEQGERAPELTDEQLQRFVDDIELVHVVTRALAGPFARAEQQQDGPDEDARRICYGVCFAAYEACFATHAQQLTSGAVPGFIERMGLHCLGDYLKCTQTCDRPLPV